jgi:hypothetical protein
LLVAVSFGSLGSRIRGSAFHLSEERLLLNSSPAGLVQLF